MKVVKSILDIYNEQLPVIEKVQKRVDEVFRESKHRDWHYTSRIKQPESYALKIETGRFVDPKLLEDFFGCTLVVENASKFVDALAIIKRFFIIKSKRPKSSGFTHKDPHSFQFDDIRLYVKIRKAEYEPEEPIDNVVFEIQIKTFLQHAWTIATHDLIYKTDALNWPKERVAFQVKAMLEQAEIAISSVKHLAATPQLKKTNEEFKNIQKALKFVNKVFSKDVLPSNTVLLARTIDSLSKNLGISLEVIESAVAAETSKGKGVYMTNLSPYMIILQAMVVHHEPVLTSYINGTQTSDFKILIPEELDLTAMVGPAFKRNGKMVKLQTVAR